MAPERLDLADMLVSPTAALFEGGDRGAGISMFVTRTPPGRWVDLHVHPYPETFLLLDGRGRWTVDGEAVELEPDQMVVVPPDRRTGSATWARSRCWWSRFTSAARSSRPGWTGSRSNRVPLAALALDGARDLHA